jgi:formate-dependent phosphoribosylglycinamide formyltransferase (GAR transformylase)
MTRDVLFLNPNYPPEMRSFTRALARFGRVWGVGDTPVGALPPEVRGALTGYLHVPSMLDEGDVLRRTLAWLGGRRPDAIEGNWEPVTLLAARMREALGVAGMSVDTVLGFRDKPLMRARVAAAGLRTPTTHRAANAEDVRTIAQAEGFPLIVKPVAGAGSANTWRVDDEASLAAILPQVAQVGEVSVERFIDGPEYTYETICVDGVPQVESVCRYHPNTLIARQNRWISPVIVSHRDLTDPEVRAGAQLGRAVLRALGMGTGFTHMEWFRDRDGQAVFGEVACRAPGANMVDLMNYTFDADFFVEWARAVMTGRVTPGLRPRWNAAIVFKRAQGEGTIRAVDGLEGFAARHRGHIARLDLLPVGARTRDWKATFLSDGNVVVRDTTMGGVLHRAWDAATNLNLRAG